MHIAHHINGLGPHDMAQAQLSESIDDDVVADASEMKKESAPLAVWRVARQSAGYFCVRMRVCLPCVRAV